MDLLISVEPPRASLVPQPRDLMAAEAPCGERHACVIHAGWRGGRLRGLWQFTPQRASASGTTRPTTDLQRMHNFALKAGRGHSGPRFAGIHLRASRSGGPSTDIEGSVRYPSAAFAGPVTLRMHDPDKDPEKLCI